MGFRERSSSSSGGIAGFLFRSILRFFQFALAIVSCGLYAADLNKAPNHKWVSTSVLY